MSEKKPAPPAPAEADEYIFSDQAAALAHVAPQTLAVWRTTGRYGLRFYRRYVGGQAIGDAAIPRDIPDVEAARFLPLKK